MSYLEIVLGVIMACAGICVGVRLFRAPIKIEFNVSVLNILQLAFSMFAVISCAMSLELIMNHVQLVKLQSATGFIKVLREVLDAGLVIAIVLPLLSLLFGKWVKKFDLDLCDEYSENVVKVYYSLVIIVNCIYYLCIMGENIMDDTTLSQNVFGRVIVWLLNVFGTWVGIGYHCKGRIDEEIENIIRSKKTVNRKEILKHVVLYGSVFIFCLALMLLQTLLPERFDEFIKAFYIIAFSFVIFMFLTSIIGICIICPSVKRSDRKLAKAINKMNNSGLEIIKSRYQRLQYSFVRHEGKKYIEICKRDVQWIGHEKEVEERFSIQPYEVDCFEYEICKGYLSKVIEEQRKFIKEKFEFCRQEKRKELKEKKKKYLI